MRILFIQVEYREFSSSLFWPYHSHVGIAQALEEAGHEVDVVLTSQAALLDRLAAERPYDLAVINDVVHGFSSHDPSCYRMPPRSLRRLRDRAIPLLGIVIESVFDDEGDSMRDARQHLRQRTVEQAAMWMDLLLTYDRFDCEVLRSHGANALWQPFATPLCHDEAESELSPKLVFIGAMYEKRQRFLQAAGLEGAISCGFLDYGASCGDVFARMMESMQQPSCTPRDTLAAMAAFKQAVTEPYVRQLQRQAVVINLPTLYRGISCRVVEGLALGRRSISPIPRHPDERALLAGVPAGVCYLYDETDPGQFARELAAIPRTPLDSASRDALRRFFEGSPFDPLIMARNITDFVGGRRSARQIETGYRRQ